MYTFAQGILLTHLRILSKHLVGDICSIASEMSLVNCMDLMSDHSSVNKNYL